MVQLFNVVDKQQKDIQAQLEEVGSSERKRSKGIIIIIIIIITIIIIIIIIIIVIVLSVVLSSIDKGRFLDMLKEHKTVTLEQCKRSQVHVHNVCDKVIMM